jgi:alkaline phosphatase D
VASVGKIDRRTFLAGMAGVGLAIGTGGRLVGASVLRGGGTPSLPADPFRLGVASGDPLSDSVVLWTRLATDPASPEPMPPVAVPVRWEVATDERFGKVVRSGERRTGPDLGHSVHVDARGLDAGREYFYRFRAGDYVSATGRTRTASDPGRRLNQIAFAVTSCQSYQAGYYTAYEQLSRDDVAFVVFLGDYIYELPGGTVRQHDLPPSETLDEFRRHYAAHHADPQLQAAHAAAPWIVTWDDHEVEDNYAGLHPGALGIARVPDAESKFPAKRAAAYRAWWENMPVRAKPPGADGSMRIYRSFRFGDLITLAVVDDRQYRTPLPTAGTGAGPGTPSGGVPQLPAAFDPDGTILGKKQERWLERTLDRSHATWNFLGQQTQMAAVDQTPEDESNGYSADTWDGYVAARNRLLGHVEKARVRNFVTLGGDTHTSSVDDLRADYQQEGSPLVGTEFVAPPASSLESLAPQFVDGALRNPHIHLYDITNKGYLRCETTPSQLEADFRYVTTIQQAQAEPLAGTSWVVESGKPGAQQS